jgi:hypothetical protein
MAVLANELFTRSTAAFPAAGEHAGRFSDRRRQVKSEGGNKSMSRKRVLKEGIQRLQRLLEAENALAQAYEPPATAKTSATVETGFDLLFSSSKSISPQAVKPYKDFSSGVWAGIQALGGACWMVIGFEPANESETDRSDFSSKAPRLTVHPVITGEKLPRWVSVQGVVDKQSLKGISRLTLRLLSSFVLLELNQSWNSNTILAKIRCDSETKEWEDIDIGHIPVTTAPMLHEKSISIELQAEKLIDKSSSLRLILFLPTQGGYVFNLYWLSLEIS